MGDPWAVKSFTWAFRKPVLRWQLDQMEFDNKEYKLLHAESELLGLKTDLSVTKYADDVVKVIVGDKGAGVEALAQKVGRYNENLDGHLLKSGFAQNKDKQVSVICLVGAGSHRDLRKIKNKEVEFPGAAAEWTRSLGAMVHCRNSYNIELKARSLAVKQAYHSVGLES